MQPKIKRCKYCGADIIFAPYINKDGEKKYTPCDPEKVSGNTKGVERLISVDELYIARPNAYDYGWQPHWITCQGEGAIAFRKEQEEKRKAYAKQKEENRKAEVVKRRARNKQ